MFLFLLYSPRILEERVQRRRGPGLSQSTRRMDNLSIRRRKRILVRTVDHKGRTSGRSLKL